MFLSAKLPCDITPVAAWGVQGLYQQGRSVGAAIGEAFLESGHVGAGGGDADVVHGLQFTSDGLQALTC